MARENEGLGKALVALCAIALLVIHFSGWRGEEAGVLFVFVLSVLCLAALSG